MLCGIHAVIKYKCIKHTVHIMSHSIMCIARNVCIMCMVLIIFNIGMICMTPRYAYTVYHVHCIYDMHEVNHLHVHACDH